MSTSFRYAKLADVPQLEQLELELFPDNSMGDNLLAVEMQWGPCWVAEQEEQIVGYLLTHRTDDVVDILRVGVIPSARRQGIAQQLLSCALRTPHFLAMLTVLKDNTPALRLYVRNGFVVVGEREKAWVMTRNWWKTISVHRTCSDGLSAHPA